MSLPMATTFDTGLLLSALDGFFTSAEPITILVEVISPVIFASSAQTLPVIKKVIKTPNAKDFFKIFLAIYQRHLPLFL